jgi:hypothetical protein
LVEAEEVGDEDEAEPEAKAEAVEFSLNPAIVQNRCQHQRHLQHHLFLSLCP